MLSTPEHIDPWHPGYYDTAHLATSLWHGATMLASLGLRVFPLQPGTKVPYGGFSWPQQATNYVPQIVGWWNENPFCNIGLVTGHTTDLLVVDIDMKAGKDGLSAAAQLFGLSTEGPEWIATLPRIRTPSGGYHLYRPYDPRVASAKLPEGVDIQADGCYVLAPPSWLQQYQEFYRFVLPEGHEPGEGEENSFTHADWLS